MTKVDSLVIYLIFSISHYLIKKKNTPRNDARILTANDAINHRSSLIYPLLLHFHFARFHRAARQQEIQNRLDDDDFASAYVNSSN